MNENRIAESECCNCLDGLDALSYTCADRKYVFTKREQDVLARIREASLQARAVKEKMRVASPDSVAMRDAEREIERLRLLRNELELERVAAAEERMRLLGHL